VCGWRGVGCYIFPITPKIMSRPGGGKLVVLHEVSAPAAPPAAPPVLAAWSEMPLTAGPGAPAVAAVSPPKTRAADAVAWERPRPPRKSRTEVQPYQARAGTRSHYAKQLAAEQREREEAERRAEARRVNRDLKRRGRARWKQAVVRGAPGDVQYPPLLRPAPCVQPAASHYFPCFGAPQRSGTMAGVVGGVDWAAGLPLPLPPRNGPQCRGVFPALAAPDSRVPTACSDCTLAPQHRGLILV
jgi:hypothetical protein